MSYDDFNHLIAPYRGNIVVDIGTGDGKFVYHLARRNPHKFYIGIDSNVRPLQKISERIYRKPLRGGAPNALFLRASVDDLPDELQAIANEVFVLFPWGSLLRAVVNGDSSVLRTLRSICAPEAVIEIVIGLDADRDHSEIECLKLPDLTPEYVNESLVPRYRSFGWNLRAVKLKSIPHPFRTSWGRKLQSGSNRSYLHLTGELTPDVG